MNKNTSSHFATKKDKIQEDNQKHIRRLVKHLRWNFSRNKLTDLQKAHIRCFT